MVDDATAITLTNTFTATQQVWVPWIGASYLLSAETNYLTDIDNPSHFYGGDCYGFAAVDVVLGDADRQAVQKLIANDIGVTWWGV